MKRTKEQQERYNKALEHRRQAIMKVFLASPELCRGASFFTELMGRNKYNAKDVMFTRTALRGLVEKGFLQKVQKRYNGKIGNSYRLAPTNE